MADDKVKRSLMVDKLLTRRGQEKSGTGKGLRGAQRSPTSDFADSLRGKFRDWDDKFMSKGRSGKRKAGKRKGNRRA
jgi:hypothetical protein